jgi:hypothetical protein
LELTIPVVEIAHILAVFNVLLLHVCVKLVLLISTHISLVHVVVVTHHLLLLHGLVLQRHDRHFLVGNVSVENDFECIVCLGGSRIPYSTDLGGRVLVLILLKVGDVQIVDLVLSYSGDSDSFFKDFFG